MAIFYNVVQQSSFSQAAEILGVSKSYISKHITKLEKHLKTRLLNRSTRQLSLTEAGEIFYQHCQSLSGIAEEGYEAILNLQKKPSGTFKISVPPAFAMHLFATPLLKFHELYPDVKFNITLDSMTGDIIQQGFDLSIGTAKLRDSSLISQKIASLPLVLCASPEYIKKHGKISHPEELSKQDFAIYNMSDKFSKKFIFTKKNQNFSVTVNSSLQSNNADFVAQMVMAGTYMAVLPEFMIKDWITQKKIITCLSDFTLPTLSLYIVYPERKFVPLKVKLFIELLKTIF